MNLPGGVFISTFGEFVSGKLPRHTKRLCYPKSQMISYITIQINFLRCFVDSSMLLFENCRELTFQAKSANLCSANYTKWWKSP